MRSRNIKPGFFINEELSELDFATRLFFIGLWCYADREGRFELKYKKIKAIIFPYDDFDAKQAIQKLMDLGFLVCNETVGQIVNFDKHQTPHQNESKSILQAVVQNNIEFQMDNHSQTNGEPMDNHSQTNGEPMDNHSQTNGEPWQTNGSPCTARFSDSLIPRFNKSVLTDAEARAHEYSETQIIDPEPKKQHRIEKQPNCPVDQIVDLYHEHCPMLPKVVSWNGTGKKSMIQRWKEDRARQSLEWWEQYFVRISSSDFLTGRIKDFSANLNWLVGTQNMEKIINGAYDNRASPAMPDRLKNNIRAGLEFLQGA